MIEEKKDDNVIFIGPKPFMNYVNGVVMQLVKKGNLEVIIKARGKFISRAVDVAEVTTKKFLKDINVRIKNIKTNSEEFETKDGKRINVSVIEITLSK